jgi:O-antigen/teichoic acid export membrane protein
MSTAGAAPKRRTLIVNAALRAFTEVAGKLASIVLFAVIARKLGEVPLGQYVLALSLTQIIWVAGDFGTNRYLLQETARDHDFIRGVFFDAVGIKVVVAGGLTLLAFAVSAAVSGFHATTWLLALVGASMVCDLVATVPLTIFIAREEMRYYTYAAIPNKYLQALIGVVILLLGGGIVDVGVAAVVSSAAALAISFWLAYRHYPPPLLKLTPRRWLPLLKRSGMFGAQDVLAQAVMRIDAILLSLLAAGAAVGWYGASYRLIDATLFITWSVVVSATPMYSYLTNTSTPTLRDIYGDSVRLVMALIVPISVTLLVCARPIVQFAYGLDQFEPSVLTLQLLAFSPIFYAISNQAATLILTRTNGRPVVIAFGAALAFNVVLNLILIPIWSYKAAAGVTLATEALLALWCVIATRPLVSGLPWFRLLVAPMAGATAMAAGEVVCGETLWLALPVGAVLYLTVSIGIELRLLGGTLPRLRRGAAAAEQAAVSVPPTEP